MLLQSLTKIFRCFPRLLLAVGPIILWACLRLEVLPDATSLPYPKALPTSRPKPQYQLLHVTTFPLPGTARHIAIQGNHAFVALNMSGMAVLDISDIEQIELLRHVATGVYPLSLVAKGNRLYVADRFYGVQLFDISKPADPRRTASLQVPGVTTSLVLHDDLIYACCGGEGMAVIKEVKRNRLQEIGRFSDVNYAKMAEISGHYAYLADSYDDAFKILDLTDPIQPKLLKSFSVGGFCDTVRISDSLAFVCNRRRGIVIIEVGDPLHPKPVAKIPIHSGSIKDIYLLQNLLLMTRDEDGLDLYDIENPTSPALLAHYDTPGNATGIAVKLPYIFVADWDKGLVVLKLEIVKAKKSGGDS